MLEKQLLLRVDSEIAQWQTCICGFGPVAAAASTARLLQIEKPDTVVLAGIAGSLNENEFAVGSARQFQRFMLEGVGVGGGKNFSGSREIELPQWISDNDEKIYDEIDLSHGEDNASALLTVCAASGDALHAGQRKQRFPDAIAEDMESFAVVLACVMANTPLIVVRGCSNIAGDRNKSNWRFEAAASAVVKLLAEI